MSISDAAELKRLVKSLGFEVYRTVQGRVVIAERVRDNLIMDSGIVLGPAGEYGDGTEDISISVTLRAQASHFPGASTQKVQEEARALAQDLIARGYREEGIKGEHMLDPSDPSQILDTSHELSVCRVIAESALSEELGHLLSTQRSSGDD